MNKPESRPRFQATTRHYHRHRTDNRDWEDWIDPKKKPESRWSGLQITVAVLFTMMGVGLFFAFKAM